MLIVILEESRANIKLGCDAHGDVVYEPAADPLSMIRMMLFRTSDLLNMVNQPGRE